MMKKIYVLFLLIFGSVGVWGQVSLTNGSPSALIDFSNSMQTGIGSNPSTAFAGAGFDANPIIAGRLNSNAWAVTGWSDGALAFGGTRTAASTDYTRGSVAIATNTGGMFAYTGVPGTVSNPALMIQPGGTDWAPGTLTLRVQNNGTTTITQLVVSYNIFIRNDQTRSNSFNFSYSPDNTTYTAVGALDYTSTAAADALGWVIVGTAPSRSTSVTGLSVAPGGFAYIRWSGADVGGTGSRDEFGLDDINLTATFSVASTPTQLAITNISPASPTVNASFSVTIQSQDAGNAGANVTANTNVTLSLTAGAGTLGGILTGTILAGTNSIVVTGTTYNTVEAGVVITATRTAGDVLTPGNSAPFNVLAAASQLVLVGVPATGFTNTNLTTFTVEARRPDNSVDIAYTSNITILKVTGPGNVVGTVVVAAVAGVATFNAVQINAIGTYTINATDGILISATSGNIVIVPPPSLNEFLLPQYIQGVNGTNNNRLPYVFRASLNFLLPNSTYRYTNLAGNAADILTLSNGAGNQIFYNAAGNFTRNISGANVNTVGSYSEFTTDAAGSYTGWFILEPTGNAARFTPGTQLHMRILLNDGLNGTLVVLALNTTNTAIVTNLGAATADGTGIYGLSHTANRDLVFLYDNVGGTGRPLTSTFLESDGTTGTTTYPTFYQSNVNAITKSWGTFIPNTLANGVRRIQYMNGGGNNVYAVTSTDGAWPGAVSTVNPTGGATALVMDRTATGTSGDFIVDSAVILATAVMVNNSLTLNNGIVTTTATNLLTLPNGASTTGASNLSFVHGPIKKIGQTLFTFPVGKTGTGYVPIEINNFFGGTPADEFTAEYIRGSARALGPLTAGAGLERVSRCEYWILNKGIATPTSLDVKVYWNANSPCYGDPYVTNPNTLTVAHFDGTGWDSYALSPSLTVGSNNAAGSVAWLGATTFSPFSLGSTAFGDNPLPITINYFNGTKNNGNHLLNWKVTCVSTASANIVMERSTDGLNYSSIYSIFATAVRCQQPFNYTDAQPAKGVNYYRLKMTDADGKVTYSSVVSLINATKGMEVMNIAPNPIVNGAFNLKISAAEKMQMEMVITDMQGRIMHKQAVSMFAGFNTIPVNVKNLAAGTYQLFGNTVDGRTKVLRFVVQ